MRALALLALLLAVGCQANLPRLPEGEAAENVEPSPVVERLVASGQAALAAGRIDHPVQNSALDFFKRAQSLDPESLEARRGLEAIVERYLTQARRAAERAAHANARSQLARARLVDAQHPGISPTTAYLALLRDSERFELPVSSPALAARTVDLRASLARFGRRGRDSRCRTQIRAPRDVDGRWLYQQLSAAPGDVRTRAQFEIGSPALIAVLCPRKGSAS
jgi:hypothetical protein